MELYQVGSETEIDGNGQLVGKGSEDELLTHLLEGILKLRWAHRYGPIESGACLDAMR